MKKTEKSYTGWYFLGIVSLIYIIAALIDTGLVVRSLTFFTGLMQKIIIPLLIVFTLLVVINYAVRPRYIVKHLGKEAGAKGWAWAAIAGIISTGPIYLWYPLLNDMQKQGVRDGYIAAFLYNRAIKPALLPLFIYYFGITYVVVLTSIMLAASIIQGYTVEKMMEVGKK